MKVLVTGGTGLLGGALLELLLAAGHEVRCLVREGSSGASRLAPLPLDLVRGDAGDTRALSLALSGMEAIVHVAGIEYAAPLVEAARRGWGGRPVGLGSTNGPPAQPFLSCPQPPQ